MERYRFLLLDVDHGVVAETARELADVSAIWPHVEELLTDARAVPGRRISVRDSRNGIVASLGVTQAAYLLGQEAA